MGHNAVHLNDEGLHKMNDQAIIEKAIKENRVILTADMDFGHILSFTKTNDVSVIQFRVFDMSPENIIAKLSIVFDKLTDELNSHSVILTVQEKKIRLKDLPI
jgi:predicted nuclease of predicted toxin-antitoxin system